MQSVSRRQGFSPRNFTYCQLGVFLTFDMSVVPERLSIIMRNFAVHKIHLFLWIRSIFLSQAVSFPR